MTLTRPNVLDFIGGRKRTFVIPLFQRNYEWKKENCKELFEDIVCLVREPNSTHYFGNVLFYCGSSEGGFETRILIDGQQRITTILLLLAALRDSCKDEKMVQEINTDLIFNTNAHQGDEYRVRLKQTAMDMDAFSNIAERKAASGKIKENYDFFVKAIKDRGLSPKDIYDSLTRLIIVGIDLASGNDLKKVQTVFEKINSTGAELSGADLIRNWILLVKDESEQKSLYENYWKKIEQEVGSENIASFLRDYLIIKGKEQVTQDGKKVYKAFKSTFDSADKKELLKDIQSYSNYYKMIIDSSFERMATKDDKQVSFWLQATYELEILLRPLILYALHKLHLSNKKELIKILELLVSYRIRHLICRVAKGGGVIESLVLQLLNKLDNNEEEVSLTHDWLLYQLSEVDILKKKFPTDEEFKEALMKYPLNAKVIVEGFYFYIPCTLKFYI